MDRMQRLRSVGFKPFDSNNPSELATYTLLGRTTNTRIICHNLITARGMDSESSEEQNESNSIRSKNICHYLPFVSVENKINRQLLAGNIN